jgi:hypothetical protein
MQIFPLLYSFAATEAQKTRIREIGAKKRKYYYVLDYREFCKLLTFDLLL